MFGFETISRLRIKKKHNGNHKNYEKLPYSIYLQNIKTLVIWGRLHAVDIVVPAYKSSLCIHSEWYRTKSTSVMGFPWDVLYSATLRILRHSLSQRWRQDRPATTRLQLSILQLRVRGAATLCSYVFESTKCTEGVQ